MSRFQGTEGPGVSSPLIRPSAAFEGNEIKICLFQCKSKVFEICAVFSSYAFSMNF